MDGEKTYTEQKKILLYQLQQLIKQLYPHLRTINPYQDQIACYLQKLSIHEQLLYEGLLHSLTVLNQTGRLKDGKRIISSKTDVVNAIKLLGSTNLAINPLAISAYDKLYDRYQQNPFTLLQAQILLRRSRSTVKRHFKILEGLDLVRKCDQKYGQQHMYCLMERTSQQTQSQGIYDQAFEDWKDFKGWVDL